MLTKMKVLILIVCIGFLSTVLLSASGSVNRSSKVVDTLVTSLRDDAKRRRGRISERIASYHFPSSHAYDNSVSGLEALRAPIQCNDINNGSYDDLANAESDSCTRICDESKPPKLCYYRFTLELYHTLSPACGNCPDVISDCYLPQCIPGDGYERGILTVNRRLTGPSIQVCKGDTVVVDVTNNMPGLEATIHWHGINQIGSPHSDGVPMVTQCPITFGTIFRYKFLVDAAGTFFWHSHDGFQKMDGIIGSLVVRQPKKDDPNGHRYDLDLPSHIVEVTDWLHLDSNQHFPGLRTHDTYQEIDSYLINGKGDYQNKGTPLAQFVVEAGKRYRFRFIGGTCLSCPFKVTIEKHSVLLIATETSPVQPVAISSFNMWAGDRYDFVVHANQTPNAYRMLVQGQGSCSGANVSAVLLYKSSTQQRPVTDAASISGDGNGVELAPPDSDCTASAEGLCVSQLKGHYTADPQLRILKPYRIYLNFGFDILTINEVFYQNQYPRYFNPIGPQPFRAWIKHISNMEAPSPLLTQRNEIPEKLFCSEKCMSLPINTNTTCSCINVIKIALNAIVEFVLIDPTKTSVLKHPMHLHGFTFHVLAQGKFDHNLTLDEAVKDLKKKLTRGSFIKKNPPMKDVISVPTYGYAIIRFVADNPGYWFFHCHYLWHHSSGMSATFQVGEPEDMAKPPENYPRCGDFLPPVDSIPDERYLLDENVQDTRPNIDS